MGINLPCTSMRGQAWHNRQRNYGSTLWPVRFMSIGLFKSQCNQLVGLRPDQDSGWASAVSSLLLNNFRFITERNQSKYPRVPKYRLCICRFEQ